MTKQRKIKMVETKKQTEYTNAKSFEAVVNEVRLDEKVWTDENNEPKRNEDGEPIILRSVAIEFEEVENMKFYDGKEFEPRTTLKNFISVSDKCTPECITQESKIDKYITEIETVCDVDRTKFKTYIEIFEVLVGKKIKYVNKKLGKDFTNSKGKSFIGKSFYVPQVLMEE